MLAFLLGQINCPRQPTWALWDVIFFWPLLYNFVCAGFQEFLVCAAHVWCRCAVFLWGALLSSPLASREDSHSLRWTSTKFSSLKVLQGLLCEGGTRFFQSVWLQVPFWYAPGAPLTCWKPPERERVMCMHVFLYHDCDFSPLGHKIPEADLCTQEWSAPYKRSSWGRGGMFRRFSEVAMSFLTLRQHTG